MYDHAQIHAGTDVGKPMSKLRKGAGDVLGQIGQLAQPEEESPMPQMEMLPNQGIIPQNNVWKSGNSMGQAVLLMLPLLFLIFGVSYAFAFNEQGRTVQIKRSTDMFQPPKKKKPADIKLDGARFEKAFAGKDPEYRIPTPQDGPDPSLAEDFDRIQRSKLYKRKLGATDPGYLPSVKKKDR
jgi:hypothetical protein